MDLFYFWRTPPKVPEHQHVCGHLRKEEEEANNSAAHSDLILRNVMSV